MLKSCFQIYDNFLEIRKKSTLYWECIQILCTAAMHASADASHQCINITNSAAYLPMSRHLPC